MTRAISLFLSFVVYAGITLGVQTATSTKGQRVDDSYQYIRNTVMEYLGEEGNEEADATMRDILADIDAVYYDYKASGQSDEAEEYIDRVLGAMGVR